MIIPSDLKKWLKMRIPECVYSSAILLYIEALEEDVGSKIAEIAQLENRIRHLESAQPKWISVEERLPGYGVGMFFIVCRDDGAVHEARFEISNGRWYELTTEGLWEIDVTHWMPMPEAPKEET